MQAEKRIHELEFSFVGNTQAGTWKGHGKENTEKEHERNVRHCVKV